MQMKTKRPVYLMKELRIFYLTLYQMRKSFAVITIPHESIAKSKHIATKCYLQNNIDIQLFRKIFSLQNFFPSEARRHTGRY